jgi:starch phosphorylase
MLAAPAAGARVHWTFHLNEGHAALLTLHLLRGVRRDGDAADDPARNVARVRERCVFTTHTPVEAGTDKQISLRAGYQDAGKPRGYVEPAELKRLAGDDRLKMTRLALNLSSYVNGVSKRHAQTTAKMFPGYDVRAITNGVHAPTWTHASFARLYDAALPQWALEPEVLERADQISDEVIWAAHKQAKRELLARVSGLSSVELRPDLRRKQRGRCPWRRKSSAQAPGKFGH